MNYLELIGETISDINHDADKLSRDALSRAIKAEVKRHATVYGLKKEKITSFHLVKESDDVKTYVYDLHLERGINPHTLYFETWGFMCPSGCVDGFGFRFIFETNSITLIEKIHLDYKSLDRMLTFLRGVAKNIHEIKEEEQANED